MRFKRGVIKLLIITLCSFGLVYSNARADEESVDIDKLKDSISSKEAELSDLEKEKAQLQAGKTNIQKVVNGLKSDQRQIKNAVEELDGEVAKLQSNIDSYNQMITAKQAEIAKTEEELNAAKQVAADQYAAMKKRIQFMYERGDRAYLDMLFSAQSFGDFLNKAEYIQKLSDYDRRKLEEYSLVVEYTDMCMKKLEEEKILLDEAIKAAEEEQNNMNVLIAEKEKQINAYEADINNKQAAIAEYEAEIRDQNAMIEALEAQVAAEKAQLDEATKIHYSGGQFAFPLASYTRISDPYGMRMHPTLGIQKMHNGIDYAAPGGTSIYAAYDGKVVTAAYSSSAGNYIMIDHGDTLYTVYMHCSALYVSKGQTVTKGQKIAAVGSTGRSTGNHLHFGVRYKGGYVSPSSYL